MNLEAFIKALKQFQHVPAHVIEQAIQHANVILPDDRSDVLEKLRDVEEHAKEFHEEEDEALRAMEKIVQDAERAFGRVERKEEEVKQRVQESVDADALLSDT